LHPGAWNESGDKKGGAVVVAGRINTGRIGNHSSLAGQSQWIQKYLSMPTAELLEHG